MNEVSTVGIDLAKSVFQLHGLGPAGEVMFRRKLRRDQVLGFFSSLSPCVVAMEACASAHCWAREIAAFGHETSLDAFTPDECANYFRHAGYDAY